MRPLTVRMFAFAALLGLALGACGKKAVEQSLLEDETRATISPEQALADSMARADSLARVEEQLRRQEQRAAEQARLAEEEARRALLQTLQTLDPVYFDFDEHHLRPDARNTLEAHAALLREHEEVSVVIEGHCDQNGSDSYNFALGDRRADTVRDYLLRLGIAKERLRTISYGKTRPVALGQGESIWAKNRRCEFRPEDLD